MNPAAVSKNLLFIVLFITAVTNAQIPSGITWDAEVGCQEKGIEYNFNVEDRGDCIKVCQGSTVTYTITGGDPQQWLDVNWQVAGGVIQSQSNTTLTVNWDDDSVTGQLLLKVETPDQRYTKEICIELLPKPAVDFTNNPKNSGLTEIQVCKGETIYFKNLSHANGGSSLVYHQWYFQDDDSYSAEFEPSHTFNTNGVFDVILTETNACNCSSSKTIQVHVMGEGLKIECNSIACEGEVENYTIVNTDGSPADCSMEGWEVQGGTIIQQTPTEVSVLWNNIDEDGFGYVTYLPEGCNISCALPVTIKVPVIKSEVEIKGPSDICLEEEFRYAIPQWPTTQVQWHITPATGATLLLSDQTNEIIVKASSPGNYRLEAVYTNTLKGCGGASYKDISVSPPDKIEGKNTVCQNDGGIFTTTSGKTYNWQIEGPQGAANATGSTISYTFPAPGEYTISIDANACIQPHSVFVKSLPDPPTGILGPTEVCLGQPTTYTVDPIPSNFTQAKWEVNNGIITDTNAGVALGETVTVIWDVNKASPSVPYQLEVSYIKEGCLSSPINIYPEPLTVNFNISGSQSVCSSSTAIYNVDYPEGDKYTWKIIQESLGSVVENPQDDEVEILWNNVSSPTPATIEVTIEKCGNQFVETYPVTIKETADISIIAPAAVCREEVASFSVQGLTGWDSIVWDFGDGNKVYDVENPTHQYTQLNSTNLNYIATVTVIHPNGCAVTATANHSIQVQPAPVATLTPAIYNSFCSQQELIDESITLNVILDSNYAAAQTIDWYRNGQGFTPSVGSASHLVTQPGYYYAIVESANGCADKTNTVHLKVGNCDGTADEDCTEVDVDAPEITLAKMLTCNTATANANADGNPDELKWFVDNQEIMALSGQTSVTFPLSGVGIHEVVFAAYYNSTTSGGSNDPCIYGTSDITEIIVPYEAQMSYEVTCVSGNMYEVKLYNLSDYFPTTPIQSEKFRINGGTFGTTDTFTLAPGMHTAELQISGSGYPACTTTVSIDLPALPNPQMQIDGVAQNGGVTEACAGEPVQFNVSPVNSNYTYTWNFGDAAENFLPDPIRNYNPSSETDYDVELTITNPYGCSTTLTQKMKIIVPDISGGLELHPPTTCEGGQITIDYTNTSGTPTSYIWHQKVNGNTINTTTTSSPSLTVNEAGTYILDAVDNNGCTQYGIQRKPVTFLETPEVKITAPAEVCKGEAFELSAAPVQDSYYTYEWQRNGQSVSGNESTLEQNLNTPGNYTYFVEVTSPAGCSGTNSFTVKVNALPEAPSVSVVDIGCQPYSVQLAASASEPGTFVWSDGQTGATVDVPHGGPYRVTFFADDGGCSSTAQIDVPVNPEAYIWVHPEGCYDLCEQQISDYYLTGPAIPFDSWAWTKDGQSVSTGNGTVNNLQWTTNAHYQLQLDNGVCEVTSKGMEWSAHHCYDCGIQLQNYVVNPMLDAFGRCYYQIDMTFFQPNPPQSFILTNLFHNGVFVPSSVILPNGVSTQSFTFYPSTNYTGGTIDVALNSAMHREPEDVFNCLLEFSLTLPPCPQPKPSLGLPSKENPDDLFIVSPNPAKALLNIQHRFQAFGKGEYKVYLYDLRGRQLLNKPIDQLNGTTKLRLEGYANGIYLLVTRKDGQVLNHKQIIIEN